MNGGARIDLSKGSRLVAATAVFRKLGVLCAPETESPPSSIEELLQRLDAYPPVNTEPREQSDNRP